MAIHTSESPAKSLTPKPLAQIVNSSAKSVPNGAFKEESVSSQQFVQNSGGAAKSQSDSIFVSLRPSIYKGEMAISIPREIEENMAKSFDKVVVGKFSQGNPGMEGVKKFLSLQNFGGNFTVGSLDKALIIFDSEYDYIRLVSRSIWTVESKPMPIFKWNPDFHVDKESSIISVWLKLPKLPVHLMNRDFIYSLVSMFGNPLSLDAVTSM